MTPSLTILTLCPSRWSISISNPFSASCSEIVTFVYKSSPFRSNLEIQLFLPCPIWKPSKIAREVKNRPFPLTCQYARFNFSIISFLFQFRKYEKYKLERLAENFLFRIFQYVLFIFLEMSIFLLLVLLYPGPELQIAWFSFDVRLSLTRKHLFMTVVRTDFYFNLNFLLQTMFLLTSNLQSLSLLDELHIGTFVAHFHLEMMRLWSFLLSKSNDFG